MTTPYITNPTVRTLLAQQMSVARADCARIVRLAPKYRQHWHDELRERVQSYRLFAIATQGALERGELKAGVR